ncbi:hypothetical protein AB0J35_48320, partial [Nonomuraea angiospora]
MARPSPYPPELRERAVRMVAEIRPNHPTEWAAMKAVAAKLGIGTAETVRSWVRRAEPICRVLIAHGLKIATSTYYAAKNRAPSQRAV